MTARNQTFNILEINQENKLRATMCPVTCPIDILRHMLGLRGYNQGMGDNTLNHEIKEKENIPAKKEKNTVRLIQIITFFIKFLF